MNQVFPRVQTLSLAKAPAGSILIIPRSEGPLCALATEDVSADNARSIVLLNARFDRRPPVIFMERWSNNDACLRHNETVRFELSMTNEDIDPRGHTYWETAGVIVSIEDQLFIRTSPFDGFHGHWRLVNIQNGSLFSGRQPENLWTFKAWRLWLCDSQRPERIKLCEFSIR